MYLFLDESGDLSENVDEKKGCSPYFVMGGICTLHPRPIARCVKKVGRRGGGFKECGGELKFSKSGQITRTNLLSLLAEKAFYSPVIVVDKRTLFPHISSEKEFYYRWATGLVVKRFCSKHPEEKTINIVIDKRTFKKNREFLEAHIEQFIKSKFGHDMNIKILHEDSHQEKCLQAADFIAGATHFKYRYNDPRFFDIIKEKVEIEEVNKPVNKKVMAKPPTR